jgi:hypothetical protein
MKITREQHSAGVNRLNKIFGLDAEALQKQSAFFATRTLRYNRRKSR